MAHKRPFVDEDCFDFPCKLSKQWEHSSHLASMMHRSSFPDGHQKPQTSDDDGDFNINNRQDENFFVLEPVEEVLNGNDKEIEIVSGCISPFVWSNRNFAEADSKSEAVHLSLFPEYFAPDNQLTALLRSDEVYSSLLDYPPLKPVSVGPEHQADVPEWNSSGHLDQLNHEIGLKPSSGNSLDDCDEEKLMGICIMSMPKSELSANYCSQSWMIGNDCECTDKGSIRCVSQHVVEAREKLRESLGQKIFEELGFCDMGEEVSKKWTEEEEKKFHKVVSSKPASLGKNFWAHLSVVFPYRTKKDLVSYYFNVFILQKRAEQNRFDGLNIDSDDEWQQSDLGAIGEDEDSGVESLTNQDVPAYCQEDHIENSQDESNDDYLIDDCKDDANVVHHMPETDEENGGDVDDMSKSYATKFFSDSDGHNDIQLCRNVQINKQDDCNFQDDSCMSYDYHQDKVDCCGSLNTEKQSSQE